MFLNYELFDDKLYNAHKLLAFHCYHGCCGQYRIGDAFCERVLGVRVEFLIENSGRIWFDILVTLSRSLFQDHSTKVIPPRSFYLGHSTNVILPRSFYQSHFTKVILPKSLFQSHCTKVILWRSFYQRHSNKVVLPKSFYQHDSIRVILAESF